MFDSLTEKLGKIFSRLGNKGRITEKDVDETNGIVSLQWESASNRQYRVEASSNLTAWTSLADNLIATGASCTFSTNASERLQFFRIYRAP